MNSDLGSNKINQNYGSLEERQLPSGWAGNQRSSLGGDLIWVQQTSTTVGTMSDSSFHHIHPMVSSHSY